MAEVDTSIYRNQQPPPNPLDMVTKLGQAQDSLGNLAVGRAVQGALGPDGEIDQGALARLLKQSPAGASKAIPTLTALQQLRQAGFATDQAGLETFQKQQAIISHLFSILASKDKPTMDDVYDIAAKALDPKLNAKKYGITFPVIQNAIEQFRGLNPQQMKQKALLAQTQSATTGEVLNAHSPQHQVVDRGGSLEVVPMGTKMNPAIGMTIPKNLPPTTQVTTPEGTQLLGEQPAPPPSAVRPPLPPADVTVGPQSAPKLDQSRAPSGSRLPPSPIPADPSAPIEPNRVPTTAYRMTPTGPVQTLRPGQAESMKGQAEAGTAMANGWMSANDESPMSTSILQNMENTLKNFKPGKGADWSLWAKNFANRNLPVPKSWQADGKILDPKSVASQEEFNKLAYQIAQSQFRSLGGTGTDSQLGSVMHTSPDQLLSEYGNKGIIQLLKGNQLAIQAKAKAWNEWKKTHGADTAQDFSLDFGQNFNPTVFRFTYMPASEREKYIVGLEPRDRVQFLHDLTYAKKSKWVDLTKIPSEEEIEKEEAKKK